MSVFGQDGDVGKPVSLGTVEVNVLARRRHFERIARLRMTRGLGGSASERASASKAEISGKGKGKGEGGG